MKKTTTLVMAMALGLTSAFAQETTATAGAPLMSKRGEMFLPEAGDWGIVVNANPFLSYIGGFFSDAGATAPGNAFINNDMVITGKYFSTATMAYRAKLRLGFGSMTNETIVPVTPGTTPATFTTNETKYSYSNITLGGGLEWRRGKTRLQGFYGAEALINFGRGNAATAADYGKTEFSYGNAITTQAAGTTRTTSQENGSTFGLTIRGFVGAEYFILPKMSLGLEFGWGLGFSKTGEGETSTESWDGTTTTTTTSNTGGNSSFGIDTDNSGGMITLGFHF